MARWRKIRRRKVARFSPTRTEFFLDKQKTKVKNKPNKYEKKQEKFRMIKNMATMLFRGAYTTHDHLHIFSQFYLNSSLSSILCLILNLNLSHFQTSLCSGLVQQYSDFLFLLPLYQSITYKFKSMTFFKS